jgi:hypothetical protein
VLVFNRECVVGVRERPLEEVARRKRSRLELLDDGDTLFADEAWEYVVRERIVAAVNARSS